jgi:hypothetical protein
LIVGVMAILVVILAPRGLVGLWRDRLDRFDNDTAVLPATQPARVPP